MSIDFTGFAFPKGTPRSAAKIDKARTALAVERRVRKQVDARDRRQCVFPSCKTPANQKHHTVYRSRGGAWDTKQIVSACPLHHRWIHDGLIELHGNPDKPPMRVLLTTLGRQAKIRIG